MVWVVLRLRQRSVSLQPHPQSTPKQKGLAASLIGIAKTDAPGIARVLQLSAIIRGLAARLCQCLLCSCSSTSPSSTQSQGATSCQIDELWSFVDDKRNKHLCGLRWMLPPVKSSVATSEIAQQRQQCCCGGRYRQSNRQCAILYTDYWQAYATVLPSNRHPCSG